jgi:hypothetical protein
MSVKKHYQKRNQELNKDLMKRWGYALPEEPIDEGLFDTMAKKLRGGSLGKQQDKLDDMPGGDIDVSKYLSTDFDAGASDDDDSTEEKADDVIGSLEDQKKKLAAFGNQVLSLLAAAGISQEEQIFKDIAKSMDDAKKALEVSDSEVKNALPNGEEELPFSPLSYGKD